MLTRQDAHWSYINKGLQTKDLDAVLLKIAHVFVEEINKFFDPKHGKNG